jgi:hypothetical protein
MKEFPPRLHVLRARDATTAVIIRRGPADTSAVIGWERQNDTFRLGQWMRGRIYDRRCDLSPDGNWFIYFALNGKWNSETGGAFTGISMAPYLKAVTLFADGSTWFGGGLFTSNNAYWLNGGSARSPIREDRRLNRDTGFVPGEPVKEQSYSWGDRIYYYRLKRSGWTFELEIAGEEGGVIFEKLAPCGWILRKIVHEGATKEQGKGSIWEEHELENRVSGVRISGGHWEWADIDRTRLVWVEKGKLMAAQVRDEGLRDAQCLKDFNGMKFEALPAPY